MKNYSAKIKTLVIILLIVVFLFTFSYIVQDNFDFFKNLIVGNSFGMLIYIILNILAIVFAPISVLPLIIVATNLWGWIIAGIISAFSWWVGSIIVYVISRRYGTTLIKKFISLERIYELEEKITIENGFWNVVFLRMVIPVDILSYALGLFSKIKLFPYALATAIGILPFAFIFAYLGKISLVYLLLIGLVFSISFLIWLILRHLIKK